MVTVNFKESNFATAPRLWQYDYGQVLQIQGLSLPTAVEIHFALQETGGESVSRVGVTRDGVTKVPIPDSMLKNNDTSRNYSIFAFIYLSDETSGETIKKIELPVKSRPKPEAFDTPEDAELFREAIQAVNEAASKVDKANVGEIVDAWLKEHPVSGADPEQIKTAVIEYMKENQFTAEDVGALPADTKIPDKTSDLQNDIDFQTGAQVQSAVNKAISNITHFHFERVAELPVRGEENIIYLFQKTQAENDNYDEYLYVDGAWELIGNTDVDLSGYALKTELPTVPDAIKNPEKLSINIGGTVVEYDGSGAVTVTIPETGMAERIEKANTDTVVELQPNKLYIFPEMETLTYTLAEGDKNAANEYHFIFQSGTTPTEVVHPSGINVGNLTVEANKIYEISVMENCLTYQGWAVN